MSDLRESLGQMLRTVDPGTAPVDAVVRRGKRIRTRRRLAAAASAVAVVAIAVAGYPALTHNQAAPAPGPVTHQPTVTDIPGPGGSGGLIASGEINGKPWRVVAHAPGKGQPQQCFTADGDTLAPRDGALADCGPFTPPDAANPVAFDGMSGGLTTVTIGQVRADVQYVAVTLTDGTQLKLIPVKFGGARFVAFPSPGLVPVSNAIAYLASGQYRAAVPFTAPSGPPVFAAWLPAGQRPPARTTPAVGHLVASDLAGGQQWSLTAYAGPWGICLVQRGDVQAGAMYATACLHSAPRDVTAILGTFESPQQVFYGSAPAAVSRLEITLSDGSVIQVVPVKVGAGKLFAFACGGMSVTKIAAYEGAAR